MRILFWSFSIISLLVGLLLLMHSELLFGIYVGALLFSLFLLWYNRRVLHPHSATARIVQEPGASETVEVPTAGGGETVETPAQDTPATVQSPNHSKVVRRLWRSLILASAAPVCLVVILANLGAVVGLSDYVALPLVLLILICWVVFLSSLGSISRTLLFRRTETGFPKWSRLLGVVSVFSLFVGLLGPMVLLSTCALRGGGSGVVPRDAFRVAQRIRVTLGNDGAVSATERYEIEPRTHFSVTGVAEIDSGIISTVEVKSLEKFEAGKTGNAPREGLRLDLQRVLTTKTENIGLLRSKASLSLPQLTLLVRDLEKPEVDPKAEEDEPLTFAVSRASELHNTVEIRMPKNSFLAAAPKAEFNSLPDKDMLTLSFSQSPDQIEVYYLRHARLKVVRDFLSQSSDHDVALSAVSFLFWPVVMILIGIFHKKLADAIVGFVSGLFKRKPKRVVGFHP